MKRLIGLALLFMFIGGVLLFAPASETRAGSLSMQEDHNMQNMHSRRMQRHHRRGGRHHRMMNRHNRRHHRRMGSNSNHQM